MHDFWSKSVPYLGSDKNLWRYDFLCDWQFKVVQSFQFELTDSFVWAIIDNLFSTIC